MCLAVLLVIRRSYRHTETATRITQQTYDRLADAGVLMSVQLNGMAWFLQNFATMGLISLPFCFG